MQLPVDLEINKPVNVTFTISDDLPQWDKGGRVFQVLLRARVVETTELDKLAFKLNGKPLPAKLLRKINRLYQMTTPRYRINDSYWYIFKLDKAHWPVKGTNTLEVTLKERDPDITPQVFLRDVELETKYLMGKNFHREFVDRDLGPYDKSY